MLDLKTYFREEGKAPSLNDNSQTKALIAQHNAWIGMDLWKQSSQRLKSVLFRGRSFTTTLHKQNMNEERRSPYQQVQ